mmetsp:Transcript_93763/g.201302  ORF Transcript_93763/g.201302 Transcript_93763/m.201302 type:complete len:261 (-) Transcript_93763:34-816(-)
MIVRYRTPCSARPFTTASFAARALVLFSPFTPVVAWQDDSTCTVDSCDPSFSLLQLSSGVNACQCLNWKTTYADGLVNCGDGLEVSDQTITASHPDEAYCLGVSFFLGQDHNYCVNAESNQGVHPKRHFGQWCYVSSLCQTLNGGKTINNATSLKMCIAEGDDTLGELTPAQLFALSESINSDSQLMVLEAYDWTGPMASEDDWEGNLTWQNAMLNRVSPQRPVVGASMTKDVYTIIYKQEVWETREGASGACVQGCFAS